MHPNHANGWGRDLARKLGIGGFVDRQPVGADKVTLHIPCAKGGHVVDVVIRANLDPNGTTKQMINAGWTVGRRRLVCPDCQPKRAPRPPKGARKGVEEQMGQQTSGIAIAASQAQPTDEARAARRAAMQWLEESFDVKKGVFAAGVNDGTIARETGLSEAAVKQMREDFFGPLGEPDELRACRDEIAEIRKRAAESQAAFMAEVQRVERRFNALCQKQGWPVS